MNNEIWKDCKGYEGKYQVSNMGRVWSVRSQKCMTAHSDKDGYLNLILVAKNGKRKNEKVHRLVALAFLDNPQSFPQVNHKDENRANNSVDNLEWCSNLYNVTYSKGKTVRCIELNKVFPSSEAAGRELGVSGSNIRKCLSGSRKTAAGYHWEYEPCRK